MSIFQQKDISGCGLSGIVNRKGKCISGEKIIQSIELQHDRGNGLGGGFAAYGIYPDYPDHIAFHMMYDHDKAQEESERILRHYFIIDKDEAVPTKPSGKIINAPLYWRYFSTLKPDVVPEFCDEKSFIVDIVMKINGNVDGAFVVSSGRNMGAFKGVGFPEDIGRYFRLEEYNAYIWTAHNRFPTNTQGWWGGAHPFTLLDWSIVHNGEISSYGINKRYLEMFGYKCTMRTDTEVVTYLLDLLLRKHKLPLKDAMLALTPPFWKDIDRMQDEEEKARVTALRQVYASAALNGPYSLLFANSERLIGFCDRIKLRPFVVAEKDDFVYMASEVSAIREVCQKPDRLWSPKAGETVVVEVEKEQ